MLTIRPNNPATQRPWQSAPDAASAASVWQGASGSKIEVAVATFADVPAPNSYIRVWTQRQNASPVALLLISDTPDGAHVCFGRAGDKPAQAGPISSSRAEAIAHLALDAVDHEQAAVDVFDAVAECNARIPGLTNGGLLALHHLASGVPARADWSTACRAGRPLLAKRGRDLLRGLGYRPMASSPGSDVLVLRDKADAQRAMAVLIDAAATTTGLLDRAYQAALAAGVPWVVAVDRHQLRLYPAAAGVGVGGRGPLESFVEVNLALLDPASAGYLHLLFSAESLAPDGALRQILADSQRFAVELGTRLRDRIYLDCVPRLIDAIVAARASARKPVRHADLDDVYRQALTTLFRLLFIAYAEDRDLLPVRTSPAYRARSLTDLASRLTEGVGVVDVWAQLAELFAAVDRGHRGWRIPAYNGGLFSSDATVNTAGAALAALHLPDTPLIAALEALLIDGTGDERGAVDFRSLSVREFGTIYEGLLESELSIAATDLSISKDGAYIPAEKPDVPKVVAGAVYLHNRSGARKAAGAYYTPGFAVDHLLEHSLTAALDEHEQHLDELVDAGKTKEAEGAFFDFRCADLAMGSGHFLVAVCDHVAARLTAIQARLELPGITSQLDQLRADAAAAVGAPITVADLTLLRRLVARRCVYGIDINPMSTELTRLSLWIHTFVPGLPMSFLGHNLRAGNSLTGIGTSDELHRLLLGDANRPPVFATSLQAVLQSVSDDLLDIATELDGTASAVHAIEQKAKKALAKSVRATAVCNIVIAQRAGRLGYVDWTRGEDKAIQAHGPVSSQFASEVGALHLPVIWPEVFARTDGRNGFHVCVGNPPWEKLKIERHAFWARHMPGLRAKSEAEKEMLIAALAAQRPDLAALHESEIASQAASRAVILAAKWPGLGTGDPDLYQAFCWRNWSSLREGGRIGMVLPRAALAGSAMARWRETIYDTGEFSDVVVLGNDRGWVFPQIDGRYTVALVSARRGLGTDVRLRGPFRSRAQFDAGVARAALPVPTSEFRTFATGRPGGGGAFPHLPSSEAVAAFRQLRLAPRFDSDDHPWRARPTTDLHSSADKDKMLLVEVQPAGSLPVISGAGFNRWVPDTGKVYAWADPSTVSPVLARKDRRRSARAKSEQVQGGATGRLSLFPDPAETATPRDPSGPRVAFRDITNATNRRTVIAAVVPPGRYLTDKAPYLRFDRGAPSDEAFVLGLLCSTTFDWLARRFVETKVSFELLNSFPVPNPGRTQQDDLLRSRIAQIAAIRTARADARLQAWAAGTGLGLNEATNNTDLDIELDALVAYAYGLDADHVRTIWATYGPGADDLPDLNAVIARLETLRGAS